MRTSLVFSIACAAACSAFSAFTEAIRSVERAISALAAFAWAFVRPVLDSITTPPLALVDGTGLTPAIARYDEPLSSDVRHEAFTPLRASARHI